MLIPATSRRGEPPAPAVNFCAPRGRSGRPAGLLAQPLGAVTVCMLLQHTAVLPHWASGPLRFEGTPGERWAYSGEGFILLQRAVEAVMRRPLDDAMQEQVFNPLGMAHSSYRWTPQAGQHLLPGTKAHGALRQLAPLQRPVAAFSLYTHIDDYTRLLIALLRDPAMLSSTAESPVDVDTGLNLSWVLGRGLEHSACGVHLLPWGKNPGYRAFALPVPGSGDGLVLRTDRDAGLK